MKERTKAKDGPADPMIEMRKRYDRCTEADKDNRIEGLSDLRFVAISGYAWDEAQRKARKNRPCYEFPILRSHWRQVVNDQKKARPQIKVHPYKDANAEGAELRQGIIRGIESQCNADVAYDAAFEMLVASGFGCFRVTTEYSEDDGWDQDLAIRPIKDVLNSVWLDPDAPEHDPCGMFAFVEEMIPRDTFETRYPKAEAKDFETSSIAQYGSWFGQDDVRIAEYWRKVPITKTVYLLSDGRSVDAADFDAIADEEQAKGVTITKTRSVKTHKVVMSIVSGAEEIEGPFDSVFKSIPLVPIWANRHFIDGKWRWAGMVRFSRDPQKLVNYNLTMSQEILAKQHKATPLITPKMLEGTGVKAMWDSSNAVETPYLPYTPDPAMPGGPTFLSPPPIHAAYTQAAQMAVDMLKASDGIYDASVGARSNETSGKAIMARQSEGDTATFDFQDALAKGIRHAGQLIGDALPTVYDTPRVVRVVGKDGAEDWQKLYEEVQDQQTGQMVTVNDLSQGKYDYTVSTGPSYDTQRMEFVDALTQLGQGNPLIAQGVPDLIIGALDFPKAEEAAERIKLLLPPPIQAALNNKDQSPAVMQLQGQMEQMQQQAQMQMQELQQALQEAQQKAAATSDKELAAMNTSEKLELDWYEAHTRRMAVLMKDQHHDEQMAQEAAMRLEASLNAEADAAKEPMPEGEKAPSTPAVSPDELRAMLAEHSAGLHASVGQTLAQLSAPRKRQTRIVRDEQGNIVGAESDE